jgi:hypothetical protein
MAILDEKVVISQEEEAATNIDALKKVTTIDTIHNDEEVKVHSHSQAIVSGLNKKRSVFDAKLIGGCYQFYASRVGCSATIRLCLVR